MKSTEQHPAIVVPELEIQRELKHRSRRGFLTGGLTGLAAIGGYAWLTKSREEDGVPWPQRRILDLNARIWHRRLDDKDRMPTYDASRVTYLKPNGNVGLGEDFDPGSWKLKAAFPGAKPLQLGLADIRSLPRVEMVAQFCCIEGWRAVPSWAGARFSDFVRKYLPPGQSVPPYVSLATPDEEYYVGLDRKSALHPQTLLAYEHNGQPLTAEHGAPLRLVIPVKYGIKNLKRIGSIAFADERPDDYWAEQGYDWFAGL